MKSDNKPLQVLCWSDAASAGTGFGIVSRYVISSIYNTGRYDIDHLAINFHGDFVDKSLVPWNMQPAKILDPADPHGMKMFIRALSKKRYDIVWIVNDLYVTQRVTKAVNEVKGEYQNKGWKPPIFIHYYPVDCKVRGDSGDLILISDIPVCYTDHGREMTLNAYPSLASKLEQIPHGVDTSIFKPLPADVNKSNRAKYLRVGEDTTVVININRNSTRKQIQYSILAFKEFKKKVPNSIMYLHTAVRDQGGDLIAAIHDLGLSTQKDVIFPVKYSPSTPVPDKVMNELYNMGDIYLTTHLGEGWGLTITEAMAAGTPVVAPNNTCMPQQLGEFSERGYLYPCNDEIWIDQSGFRRKGLIPDIVEQMMDAYKDGKNSMKTSLALTYAKEHDWEKVCKRWIKMFEKVDKILDSRSTVQNIGEQV